MASTLVIGEALVDVVRVGLDAPVVQPGGSPLNVAVGLARLGVPTTLHSAFGADDHGNAIFRHLAASGVVLSPATVGTGATSTAVALVGADGSASYDFRITWNPAPVESRGYDLVHTGSIGASLEPGARLVEEALLHATGMVSFDPNIRPALARDRSAARERVERIVAMSDVVKASDEDLAWLYPDHSVVQVLARWYAMGPRLVVVTRGSNGADALTDAGSVHVDGHPTKVADTIGAGDSFMAALLADLLSHGFDDPTRSLDFAAHCAGITVGRSGANPPWRDEVAIDHGLEANRSDIQ